MKDRLNAARSMSAEPVIVLQQCLRDALELARSLRLVDIDIDSVALPQPDDFVTGTIIERNGEWKVVEIAMLQFTADHSKSDCSEFGMPLS